MLRIILPVNMCNFFVIFAFNYFVYFNVYKYIRLLRHVKPVDKNLTKSTKHDTYVEM